MISKIRGTLERISEGSIEIVMGDMTYCILTPVILLDKLKAKKGQKIELFTYHYYEVEKGSGNMVPRLIGFYDEIEKDFFEKFITVKRVGVKTALNAINIPTSEIAMAIETRNVSVLTKLPKIGKRAAEQIIAELNGKMDAFIVGGSIPASDKEADSAVDSHSQALKDEALAILTQLNYRKNEAQEMIDKTFKNTNTKFNSVEEFIQAIYSSAHMKK